MNIKELTEKVDKYVCRYGPVLPVRVAREINTDIIFASAILSQLVSEKRVMLSHANIGGSPLYYVSGQEMKLQVLYDKLAHIEKKAYSLLREKRVLIDSEQEPSIRVALRNIKDFAKMLNVESEGNVDIFWKWFLVSDKEAEQIIDEILSKVNKVKEEVKKAKEEKAKVEKVKEEKIKEKQAKLEVKKEKVKSKITDNFLDSIMNYFKNEGMEILEHEIIRKN